MSKQEKELSNVLKKMHHTDIVLALSRYYSNYDSREYSALKDLIGGLQAELNKKT